MATPKKRAPARRRPRKAKAGTRGITAPESRLETLTGEGADLKARIEGEGGYVLGGYKDPLGSNPLVGPNEDRFGLRFPDMSEVYSKRLRAAADETARDQDLPIAHGIYVAVHGPSYETPAEIRFLRTIGADAVGMSTVPEAIVARHMGVEVLGISCITNAAAGVLPQPLNHEEVMAVARQVRGRFAALLEGIIGRL